MACPASSRVALFALLLALVLAWPAHAATSKKTPTKAKATTATTPAKTKPASKQAETGTNYGQRQDAMQLADEIAEQHGLDREQVRKTLSSARALPSVARLILPAAATAAKNWQLYRSRFIEPFRINAGLAFWKSHRSDLERAEKEFGVPAQIIVGIIGVETIYGRQMGSFRVLDALATLSLDFPPEHPRAQERRAFFRAELGHFLRLKKHTGMDPLAWRGSYAGAMGLPQFMPSSWIRFAVDFDGDGKIDLFNNVTDVIGSVANYMKAFNWQSGMPTHYAVRFDRDRLDMEALMAPDILPTFSVASFQAKGAMLDERGQSHQGPLALVELQNGAAEPQYLAGTENFYAITRYNWSSYYAMAVIELGEEVAAAMRREASTPVNRR